MVCVLGIALSGGITGAEEWSYFDDTQFSAGQANCYGQPYDCLCDCAPPTDCGCSSTVCLSPCEEFSHRMEAMAKAMEDSGFIYVAQVPQFYQGVASGGHDQEFEYGGKVDQFLILNTTKLGWWDGMTMTMHAETRYGNDVNLQAVGFAPANIAMLYPNEGEHDTAITNLSFAQAISEGVQLTFGKFNAVDLFYSLYPQTGRGVDGFMNASMVIPMSVARVVPLSFMGAGALKYQGTKIQGGLLTYDTNNCTTTSGFDDLFDNGANILGFWRFFTEFGGMPGSQMVGGIWSTGEFVAFDPTGFVIVPDEGLVAVPQNGAYSLIYIGEQSLWIDSSDQKRNISLLSAWGVADEATSPIGWSANIGLQARGFASARPNDAFGVGYFYTGLSDNFRRLLAPVREFQDVQGVELFYNASIAKMFQMTMDFQFIQPADERNDTAVVVGLRGTASL